MWISPELVNHLHVLNSQPIVEFPENSAPVHQLAEQSASNVKIMALIPNEHMYWLNIYLTNPIILKVSFERLFVIGISVHVLGIV